MVAQFAVHAFRVVNPAHHPHSQLPPGGVETTGLQHLQARHEGCLSALLQRSPAPLCNGIRVPLQQNQAANGRRHAHRERPTGRQGQAAALPGLAHGVGFANVREAMGMAAAEDTPALTLEIGSGRVPYRDFQKIVGAFTGLLNAISEEACGDPQAVHWEISVSEGSVLIVARLPAATDASGDRRPSGQSNSGNCAQTTDTHPQESSSISRGSSGNTLFNRCRSSRYSGRESERYGPTSKPDSGIRYC